MHVFLCEALTNFIMKLHYSCPSGVRIFAVESIAKYLKSISLPNEADLYKLSVKREEKGDETQAATGTHARVNSCAFTHTTTSHRHNEARRGGRRGRHALTTHVHSHSHSHACARTILPPAYKLTLVEPSHQIGA